MAQTSALNTHLARWAEIASVIDEAIAIIVYGVAYFRLRLEHLVAGGLCSAGRINTIGYARRANALLPGHRAELPAAVTHNAFDRVHEVIEVAVGLPTLARNGRVELRRRCR